MKAKFFKFPQEFREWFEKHHLTEKELLVGFYKVGTGKRSMTWPESVDQALCFGWIDGIRRSIDQESYSIRFTPRKPTSIWSAVNIKKMDELTQSGLVTEAGLKAFALRTKEKSAIYSHENESPELNSEFEKQFIAHTVAWEFFNSQAPSYRKAVLHWIMGAKQEKTRISRLEKTIRESGNQKRIL
ncbi:YdeI family protein [uncultured Chryseobacterium sp.]|uniref:YdeI/OmpD-associated family protein n=1 Tax=uncultured Chryseobacterium sp. TaxID=259322 RepID=UPI0025D724AE|nr:YdeI/OmpD-associated family protein [uncultured Chryseobacterium sp.]